MTHHKYEKQNGFMLFRATHLVIWNDLELRKDASFHVSFHVKFGNMRCCDFSIDKLKPHVWLHVF